jgi:hypothetical protein
MNKKCMGEPSFNRLLMKCYSEKNLIQRNIFRKKNHVLRVASDVFSFFREFFDVIVKYKLTHFSVDSFDERFLIRFLSKFNELEII